MSKLKTLKPRLSTSKALGVNTHQPKARWGSGRGGRPWRHKRLAVFNRDKFTCQTCGRVAMPEELECDHIVPVSQGGTDDMDNLATICIPCHKPKTQKESEAGRRGLTQIDC